MKIDGLKPFTGSEVQGFTVVFLTLNLLEGKQMIDLTTNDSTYTSLMNMHIPKWRLVLGTPQFITGRIENSRKIPLKGS